MNKKIMTKIPNIYIEKTLITVSCQWTHAHTHNSKWGGQGKKVKKRLRIYWRSWERKRGKEGKNEDDEVNKEWWKNGGEKRKEETNGRK